MFPGALLETVGWRSGEGRPQHGELYWQVADRQRENVPTHGLSRLVPFNDAHSAVITMEAALAARA